MILDLTAPFFEKYVYKDPIQREAWGPIYPSIYLSFEESIILLDNIQGSSWRTFFLRGKIRIHTEPNIPDRESLP